MNTLERVYEEAKRKISYIAKLAVIFPHIKKHADKDAAVQVLSMNK